MTKDIGRVTKFENSSLFYFVEDGQRYEQEEMIMSI